MIAGRYDLEREIGRGGMGAVWLGRDTVLGREVALKRIGLMPGAESPDLVRAEREARLAARLNHPHVVAVFDLVEEESETWLVMEYVEGVTLSALIKRDGALSPDEAAPLIRQAADALAAAHDAGIVHRDVKPSNMLVTPDGQVKLTDFGIARAEADASLTQTGLVTGSPAYLSPEVASGATATEASDVWALGATLFHALAGRTPYDVSENLMGALYKIVHEDPPRLADAGWLAPALEHTMTREPGDRWSMAEVRDFLDQGHDVTIHPAPIGAVDDDGTRVLQPTPSEPVAVPPVVVDPHLAAPEPAPAPGPTPHRVRRRRSPWPWVAASAVLVAVAVIAFAVLTGLRGGGTAAQSPPPATHGSSSPVTDPAASRAQQMTRFLGTYLATVTSDRHAAWAMLTKPYQAASGGFGSYNGFWSTIRSATPSNVTADPSAMTVTYDVAYVKADGQRTTEHHTLQLVRNGSTYLINAQLS
ncbi:MAG TPA: serine/threonine-protein kinase [Nocardioides sp.]|nr:serine/threonine-protein kinase [Nocardioides sp.]